MAVAAVEDSVAPETTSRAPPKRGRLVCVFALALALPWLFSLVRPATAAAADPCDPTVVSNPVACENSKPGNPQSEWDVALDPSPSIEGFATDISVNHGQTVHFKIKTSAAAYRIDIYRMGYYGGMGARKVATVMPSVLLPQLQPPCAQDTSTGLVDCGNWAESASWTVPADAVSGVYIARMVRLDTMDANHIVFVVRDDESHSKILFKTSDTTWQAYNNWGGNSFYWGSPANRAYKVSYNRPFDTRVSGKGRSFFFAPEYPMVRFLERNGYDVSYFTSVDADRFGSKLLDHKVVLSVGHDEYWSAAERANMTAARDAGVNLAFFSGNEMFWKTRWEPSVDGTNTPYRTLVCYKETLDSAKTDPSPTWTGTWRDPRFSPPSDGGRPENSLTGQLFQVNADRDDPMYVPAQYGKLRFWRNTDIANLAPGQTATLPTGVLGYEWDEDKDNGFRPAGEFDMSSSTYAVSTYLGDYGAQYGNGTATHHLTMYRAASGALVFGAGTVQWAFGLDATHDYGGTPVDSRMQQATVNLLADMDAQPVTLDPALVPATKSTDATPPTSTITSPASGTNLSPGTPVTITGTASDAGGGAVAGVEVSVDGGTTWHPATGTTSWTYTWSQGIVTTTIKSRAVDDSANLETPSPGVPVTVGQTSCPCSIWGTSAAPATTDSGDTGSYELGVRFRADVDGYVTGIRYYKASLNTGTHVGRLWTNSGTLLASATFTAESGSGWQQVTFSSPVAVTANTTYVASYSDPNGHFSLDRPAFATLGVDNPPLHALKDGLDGANGVYAPGPGSFPTNSLGSSNYWVDVVFQTQLGTDTTPPTVTTVAPPSSATGVPTGTTVTAQFSEAMDASTITGSSFQLRNGSGTLVPATIAYVASTHTATLTANAPLASSTAYTATVKGGSSGATDAAGNALAADYVWSFTTGAPGVCPCSIWSAAATPATTDSADTGAYELGVRFRSDVDGYVTGIRFYKATQNTGTHVGRLWTNGGTLLVSATFTSESGSGWQQVTFANAVSISANTTYVASYSDPNGHYSVDRPGFSAGVDNPPLHALRDGLDGANGVFAAGTGLFPASTVGSSNYWVDVVFSQTDTTPPTVTSVSPGAGATGVGATTAVTAQFSKALDPATVTGSTFQLKDASNNAVAATVTYNSATKTATLTPNTALATGTAYTATVKGGSSGVKDTAGNALAADYVWSFSTGTPGACPCSIWSATATPATVDSGDTASYELGVRFRSDVAGYVTGLRFYKGAQNTGTHVGRLWTNAGTQLANATFTSETGSGWQQVMFSNPVSISANTTYVASYSDPNGHFSVDRPAFATAGVDNPPLHALRDGLDGANGVYADGAGFFPTSTVGSSNYWVDVVFSETDTTPPSVTSVSPTAGATGVVPTTAVTAQFSKALDASSVTGTRFQLTNAANAVVPATVSASASTATLQPTNALAPGTTYTATLKGGSGGVTDSAGNPLPADYVWTFTTAAPATCPCSIWSAAATPATADSGDTGSYELGVRFRADIDGYVTAIRFYKGAQNTGTHVGRLWTSTGTQLASATFTSESASGWQQVAFSSPVPVNANTTYIASYSDPNGHFSADRPAFASAGVDSLPLHALKDGVDGANGIYADGAGAFPTNSVNSSNYWVDVVFDNHDTTPPTVTTVSPAAGASTVSPGTTVTAQFSEAMTSASISSTTFQLKDPANTVVPASVSYDAGTRTAALTPTAPLASGKTYTATVKGGSGGVTDTAGNALTADYTWSFTTSGSITCPCSIWSSAAMPVTVDSGDPGAYELGVRFRADVDGYVTGIRFYKASLNTGTHLGRLWTNSGTLLASATFTGESASGWQQVTFSSPVALTANTTYVASYTAPNGHYSVDRPAFAASGVDNPPLHALKDGLDGANGVFSAGGGFPANTSGSSNYWVDVVFSPNSGDVDPPTSTTSFPAANGTYGLSSWNAGCATAGFCGTASDPGSGVKKVELSIRQGSGNYWDGTSFASTTEVFNAATLSGSSWSYAFAGAKFPAAGTYTVRVRSADNAGNVESAASRTFTYDATAPSSTTTFPASAGNYNATGWSAGCATAGFCGTASDVGSGLQKVELSIRQGTGNYWNGTGFASTTEVFNATTLSGSSWSYAFAATSFPANANYTIRVRATDAAGNVETPSSRTFRYDTTAPSSSYTFPASSGTYNMAGWNAGCATAGLCGSASDSGAGVQTVELSLRRGTANYWNGTAFASTSEVFLTATLTGSTWSFPFAAANFPADGSYTARLRATDKAGNVQTPVSRSFTYDTTPPLVSSTSPAAGATGVAITANTTVTFNEPMAAASITATTFVLRDAAGNVVAANVSYNAGQRRATLAPPSTLASLTTYTATVSGGAGGVTDAAGNPLASNFTWSFRTG